MKAISVIERIEDMKLDLKAMKQNVNRHKKKIPPFKKKTIVNGAVGFALLVTVVAVVTPFVKAQSLKVDTEIGQPLEMVILQKETADFIQLNNIIVNYANATLSEIYSVAPSELSTEEMEMLLAKQYGLMQYKEQISPSNSIFMDLSENTVQKITILLSVIDNFLNNPVDYEENMLKLNLYTNEYKRATERENNLLIELLNLTGMSYEILEDGQIRYTYLSDK